MSLKCVCVYKLHAAQVQLCMQTALTDSDSVTALLIGCRLQALRHISNRLSRQSATSVNFVIVLKKMLHICSSGSGHTCHWGL